MQYLSEPFFDDLRTKQQLGYVVFSRHEDIRDVLGCQFLIQSSHKSCEYLINCINIFLVQTRETIKNITDEIVDVQKQAVHTQIACFCTSLMKLLMYKNRQFTLKLLRKTSTLTEKMADTGTKLLLINTSSRDSRNSLIS